MPKSNNVKQPEVYTIKEVCRLMNISATAVENLLKQKQFPEPIRLGPRIRRWRKADLDKLLNAKN